MLLKSMSSGLFGALALVLEAGDGKELIAVAVLLRVRSAENIAISERRLANGGMLRMVEVESVKVLDDEKLWDGLHLFLYLKVYAFERRYSLRRSGACMSFASTQVSSNAE